MTRVARKAAGRLVGVGRRSRALLLRTTALQAAVLVAVELPGGIPRAAAQPAPNARPIGGSVVAGQASISQSPTTTTIDQTSQRAAINWNSFNVGRSQTVDFQQPSTSAWTLNRVTGPDPSQIAGRIDANGNVVLINPSGVVFYRGSEVNAQSAVIAAPGITNRNFMAGRMVFNQAPHPDARIANAGSITIKQAGLAALVAPQVVNSGVISAKLGHAVLAGATAATLDMYGDGLLSFDVTGAVRQIPLGPDGKPATALVTNTGAVLASGGTVQLTARAADGIVQDLVDAKGRIAANTAGSQTGGIEIAGTGGSIKIAGQLSATGAGAVQQGGQIELNATRSVVVARNAVVDASGGAGGGTVAVGTTLARAEGGPSVTPARTAARTLIRPGAAISADASDTGNGGKITVLSKRATAMRGTLAARGGPHGGNGGNVEVSGEQRFALTGQVDVSNRGPGVFGTLLLDPTDLTVIVGQAGSGNADGTLATNMGTLDFNQGPSIATVTNGELDMLGTTDNIVLQATHNLNVDAGFSGSGNIDLRAGHVLTVAGTATVSGHNIRLDGGENFNTGRVGGKGGVIVNGTLEAFGEGLSQATIQLHGGSLGVTVNGFLDAGRDILVVATGPAGVHFGRRSRVSTSVLDLNTIGGGGVTQAGTNSSRIGAGDLESSHGIVGDVSLPSTRNNFGFLDNFMAGGSISLASFTPGDLNVTGRVTSPTSISLDIGGPLTISGTIDAPTVSLRVRGDLGATGNFDQTGGSIIAADNLILDVNGSIDQSTRAVIVAGTLSGRSGGATALPSAANSIANLGNFTDGNGFALTDATALALSGTLKATGVSLIATGGISETGGEILGTSFTARGPSGSISLTNPGNVFGTVGTVRSSGDIRLTSGSLDLSEPVIAGTGRTIDLTTNSLRFFEGPSSLRAPAGTVILEPLALGRPVDVGSAGGAGSLDIFPSDLPRITAKTLQIGSATAGTVNIGDTGSTFTDTIDLSNLMVGTVTHSIATLDLQSGAAVTEGGDLTVHTLIGIVGTGSGGPGSVVLTNTNSITTLGSFSAADGLALDDAIALRVTGPVLDPPNITLDAPSLTIAGLVSASGTVDLIASVGSISELGSGVIDAGSLTGGAATSVSLRSASNAIATLDNFAADSGEFALTDRGNLVIAGEVFGSTTVDLVATGTVSEAAFGIVVTPTLIGNVGAATLDQTNFVADLGRFTSSAGFVLDNGEPLAVSGPVSGTAVTLTSGGSLTVSGRIAAATIDLIANTVTSFGDNGATVLPGDIIETGGGSIGGSSSVVLSADGSIDQIAGVLSTPNLSGSSGGTTNLPSAGNAVATLGGFSSVGGFTLADGQALSVSGPVTDTASVTLNVTGALALGGTVTAPDIALTASGAITQPGGALIATGTLSGAGAGVTLGQGGNQVANLGAFTSTGDFLLADSVGVTIAAGVSTGTGATLTIADNSFTIGAAGALNATPSGTIVLEPLTAGATFALNGAAGALPFTADTLVLGSLTSGPVTISNDVNLSGVTVLDVLSGASITEAGGAVLTVGTLEGQAGTSASFAQTNSIATLAGFTATDGFTLNDTGDLTVRGPVIDPPLISITTVGTLTVAGILSAPTVDLTALSGVVRRVPVRGDIIETAGGAIGVTGTTDLVVLSADGLIDQTGGVVDTALLRGVSGLTTSLANPSPGGNAVANLGSFSSTGGFALTDGQALTVSGPVTDTATITLSVTGALALAGTLTAPDMSLTASGAITQPSGAILASGTLSGAGAGVTLGQGGNQVANLGSFTSTGDFLLADSVPLTITAGVSTGAGTTLTVEDNAFTIGAAGALNATPTGTIVLEPLTAGTPMSLTGTASALPFTANTLVLGSPTAGPITISNDVNLSGVAVLDVLSGGNISEAGGTTLTVAELEGNVGGSASFTATNFISTLAGFTAGAGFALDNTGDLIVTGPVTGPPVTAITTVGTLTVAGILSAPTVDPTALSGVVRKQPVRGDIIETAGGAIGVAGTTDLVVLSADGLIDQTGGVVDTALLRGVSGLTASLANPSPAGNAVATLGSFSSTGGFALTDGQALTVSGPVTDTASITITSAGAMSASGNIAAPTVALSTTSGGITQTAGNIGLAAGVVALNAAGSIDQTGGAILANALSGSSGGATNLPGTGNRIVNLGSFASGGDFLLADSVPVNIASSVSTGAGTTLTVEDNAFTIGAAGALNATPTGTIVLEPLTAGTPISLTGIAGALPFTANTLVLGSPTAGPITISNDVNFADVGSLDVLSSSSIVEQPGATLVVGALEGSVGGSASFDQTNSIAALGSFSSAGEFALADARDLTLIGNVSAPAIDLVVAGPIAQSSGVLATGTLSGAATSAALGDANAIVTIGSFTTDTGFTLTDARSLRITGPLTDGRAITLDVLGKLALAGRLAAPSVDLVASGAISEPGGSIGARTLTGSARSATLNGGNAVTRLGNFAAPRGLALTDQTGLTIAGAVDGGTAVALTVSGALTLASGSLSSTGLMALNTTGAITDPGGAISAGTLTGSATGLAQFGGTAPGATAAIGTLGAFTVQTGTLALADSVPLQIPGPIAADDIGISAPGSIVLVGGTITTLGLPVASQLGGQPAGPGSFFQVLAGQNGTGQFVQLGVTTIDPPNGVVPTLRIQVPDAGGTIVLNDLVGPTANLVPATQAGSMNGNIDVASLHVLGATGNANLFGTVAGISGPNAAPISFISPAVNDSYLLNLCVIMSPICGGLPSELTVTASNPSILIPPDTLGQGFLPGEDQIAVDPAASELAVVVGIGKALVAGVTPECRSVGTLDTLTSDCVDIILPNISDRDY